MIYALQINKENDSARGALPTLRKEQDRNKKLMSEKYAAMKKLKGDFKRQEEDFFAAQKVQRKLLEEEVRKEKELRKIEEEERIVKEKALEESRIPYEVRTAGLSLFKFLTNCMSLPISP